MFRQAFVALSALSSLVQAQQALNLTVASSGGNATSPLQYGIMFEVRFRITRYRSSI